MVQRLFMLLAAGLFLYPFAARGQDYGSQSAQDQQTPPVAQALMREGDFAIKLTASLELGSPGDEASAEELLVSAGIAPQNGWVSDYPVTPVIVGQLRESILTAAEAGALSVSAQEATDRLYALAKEENLPVPAGAGPMPTPDQAVQNSNPSVVNNYYYNQGPPIVTYYPPPADYVYLYDWVPYPSWWFGFWFPGFFICRHFTTVIVSGAVVVNRVVVADHRPVVVSRPVTADGRRRVVVSNRIVDPATSTVSVLSPSGRIFTPGGRLMPQVRREGGIPGRIIPRMRQEPGAAGTIRGGTTGPLPGTIRRNDGRGSGMRRNPATISPGRGVIRDENRGRVVPDRSLPVPAERLQPSRGQGGGRESHVFIPSRPASPLGGQLRPGFASPGTPGQSGNPRYRRHRDGSGTDFFSGRRSGGNERQAFPGSGRCRGRC